MLTKRMEKKLDGNAVSFIEKSPGGNTPQNSNYTAIYHLSWKLSKLDEPDMQDTAGEVRTNS